MGWCRWNASYTFLCSHPWILSFIVFCYFFAVVQSFPRDIFFSLWLFIYYFCCFCGENKCWDLLALSLLTSPSCKFTFVLKSFTQRNVFEIDSCSWVWVICSFLLLNTFHYGDIPYFKKFILPLKGICFNFFNLGILWIKLFFLLHILYMSFHGVMHFICLTNTHKSRIGES